MNEPDASKLMRRLRHQIAIAGLFRVLLIGAIVASSVFAVTPWVTPDQARTLWVASLVAVGCWIVMMILGFRQARSSNQAAVYIATGRLDLAEKQLRQAALAFNLHRRGKLLACHNLAVVAHGRKDYLTAATLCTGVISMGRGALRGVSRICKILLADSLLELGDPQAANRAIDSIQWNDPDIPLAEQLLILPISLRCDAALRNDDRLLGNLADKIKRAELLDAPKASLCHGILGDACERRGLSKEATFLHRRAAIYHDVTDAKESNADAVDAVAATDDGNSLAVGGGE